MFSIIDILREAVEQVATFKVKSVELIGDQSDNTYKFTSCDFRTYWLKTCIKVEVQAGFFGKVVSVENNNSFIIKFDAELIGDVESFEIPAPTFVHGTMPMANIEIKNALCPMPMSYLFELFTQKFAQKDNPNEYFAESLRIFFLADYGNTDLTTSDHYKNVIYPMQNFAFFVLENLKADILRVDKDYIESNTYKLINRVKTGVFKGTKGNEKSSFTRNLSGVELVLTIGVKKDPNCCNCC
jgi:hypothetical protein